MNCSDSPPHTWDFYRELSSDVLLCIGIGLASCLTVIILAVFGEELHFIYQNFGHDTPKSIRYGVLLGLYPVVSLMSLLAVLVPTSGVILDLIASCYLSFCIYIFITITIDAYGSQDRMLETLADDRIVIATPPCCFLFFCCLKPITMTKKSLRIIELFAMQVMIVRPCVLLVATILWTDGLYEESLSPDTAYGYIVAISACSTLLSLYGLIIIFRASKDHLKHYRLILKFIALQSMVILLNLQNFILNELGSHNVLKCVGILGPRLRAESLNNILLVMEAFLLGLVARRGYRFIPASLTTNECPNIKTNGLARLSSADLVNEQKHTTGNDSTAVDNGDLSKGTDLTFVNAFTCKDTVEESGGYEESGGCIVNKGYSVDKA